MSALQNEQPIEKRPGAPVLICTSSEHAETARQQLGAVKRDDMVMALSGDLAVVRGREVALLLTTKVEPGNCLFKSLADQGATKIKVAYVDKNLAACFDLVGHVDETSETVWSATAAAAVELVAEAAVTPTAPAKVAVATADASAPALVSASVAEQVVDMDEDAELDAANMAAWAASQEVSNDPFCDDDAPVALTEEPMSAPSAPSAVEPAPRPAAAPAQVVEQSPEPVLATVPVAQRATPTAAPKRRTFAAFVAEHYSDPDAVLGAFLEDAIAAAASVNADLNCVPELDFSWHYLPNKETGQSDKKQGYRGEVVVRSGGVVLPKIKFHSFRKGEQSRLWSPRDLIWSRYQTWKNVAQPASAVDRSAEYARAAAEKMAATAAKRAYNEEQAEKGRRAAKVLAQKVLEQSTPAEDHSYTTLKGVNPCGILRIAADDYKAELWSNTTTEWQMVTAVKKGELLAPMFDANGEVVNIQRIRTEAEGGKRPLLGGQVSGCWLPIGSIETALTVDGRPVITIEEGVATAMSMRECTGHFSISAYTAGNLPAVARRTRARYPNGIILLGVDNDQETEGNPGLTKASEAAKAVGGILAVPTLAADSRKKCDFNDLHVAEGAEAVCACVDGALSRLAHSPQELRAGKDAASIPAGSPTPLLAPPGANLAAGNDAGPAGSPPGDFNDCSPEETRAAFEAATVPTEPYKPTLAPAAVAPSRTGILVEPASVSLAKGEALMSQHFEVLGYDKDEYFIYHRQKEQVLVRTGRGLNRPGLLELAPPNFWEMNFQPTTPGTGKFDEALATQHIYDLAHVKGVYNPAMLRGRGAWKDEGRMIYHSGDRLFVDGALTDLGKVNSRFLYERSLALPAPAAVPLSDEDGLRIATLVSRFGFVKRDAAKLLAGWIFLAPVAGALRWRPHLWLFGPAGSGKTTLLQSLVAPLLGESKVYSQGDSTEAGIRQTLKSDALPLMIDESEANAEDALVRVQKTIVMLRQASSRSDAKTLRGTAKGHAQEFHIQSMAILGSIAVAIAEKADNDRFCRLELKARDGSTAASENWAITVKLLADLRADQPLAQRILARGITMFEVLDQNITQFIRAATSKFGDPRHGDQYGTLLAGWWTLAHSSPVTVAQAAGVLADFNWADELGEHDESDGQKCIRLLCDAMVRAAHGENYPVRTLLARSLDQPVSGVSLPSEDAKRLLNDNGINITRERQVAFANQHPGLKRLLAGEKFVVDLRSYLLQVRGATKLEPRRFGAGATQRAIGIPFREVGLERDEDTEGGPL